MKQLTLKTNDNSRLKDFVRSLRDTDDYKNASSKFIYVCEPVPDETVIKEHIRILSAELPDNTIVGISSCASADKSRDDGSETLFSFLTFESSDVHIFTYSCKCTTLMETGKMLRRELRYMDDIALCLIFSAGVVVEMDDFLNSIDREDFPLIGIEAGTSPDFSGGHSNVCADKPLIFSDRVCDHGIIAVVLRGKGLKLNYTYDIGWHPIGKELTATDTDGSYCISKIDGEDAISVYRKYLGVVPDRYFVQNVREFPIVTTRGNIKIVRCPVGYDHNGRLYFVSQVEQGHKMHLSYANPRRLVSDTRRYARSMSGFKPQGLFLIICETRDKFLGDLSHEDIKSWSRANKELVWTRGFAGIMKKGNNGGVVNSALIAVGLREGSSSGSVSAENTAEASGGEEQRTGAIPLNERLAMFLEETTRELEEAATAARGANEAKSTFLSNMSHEIRTPINAVLGMNEMIIRESRDPHVVHYAEKAYSASMNLLNIINDILDFSKIEAGKMEILPVEYEMISVISDLIVMIKKRAEDKKLEFKTEIDPTLPSVLTGDEVRVRQVITNLLTNAVKYTEKGCVTLKIQGHKTGSNTISLKVEVKDTGIGIKAEDMDKLFSAFDRIESKRNRHIEGTGLGMSITQSLLEMMDSRLEVESVYGEGSVFSFELEQEIVDPSEIGDIEKALSSLAGSSKKYREKLNAPSAKILVVDDTPMNLTVIRGLLKTTMIQVDTAESGAEALSKFAHKDYDMVFLDHRMSDMDGVETLNEMKKRFAAKAARTPVVCLTANAISGAREQYIKAGFTDYLTKPVISDLLENMLIKYLPKNKVYLTGPSETAPKQEKAELPQWLKTVAGLDTAKGLGYCGTVKAYLEALNIFHSSIESKALEVENSYNRSDWGNYTIKVHALKSMARSVGATELFKLAEALEQAGDNGDMEKIHRDTSGFLKLYRSFGKSLSPIDGDEKQAPEDTLPLIKDAQIKDAYNTIREIASSFDFDTLTMIMDSLKGYRFPDSEKERYEALKAAAAIPDWDKLAGILDSDTL